MGVARAHAELFGRAIAIRGRQIDHRGSSIAEGGEGARGVRRAARDVGEIGEDDGEEPRTALAHACAQQVELAPVIGPRRGGSFSHASMLASARPRVDAPRRKGFAFRGRSDAGARFRVLAAENRWSRRLRSQRMPAAARARPRIEGGPVHVVRFAGKEVRCPDGANLRMVLMRARLPLYNSVARALNCRGLGTCGTCAVRVEGKVSAPTPAEERRLGFPPHARESGLRLACQCEVHGDLVVTKHRGLWGQKDEPVEHDPARARDEGRET